MLLRQNLCSTHHWSGSRLRETRSRPGFINSPIGAFSEASSTLTIFDLPVQSKIKDNSVSVLEFSCYTRVGLHISAVGTIDFRRRTLRGRLPKKCVTFYWIQWASHAAHNKHYLQLKEVMDWHSEFYLHFEIPHTSAAKPQQGAHARTEHPQITTLFCKVSPGPCDALSWEPWFN